MKPANDTALLRYCGDKSRLEHVRTVLKGTGSTPMELHLALTFMHAGSIHSDIVTLLHDAYKRKRNATGDEMHLFTRFDQAYYHDLALAMGLYQRLQSCKSGCKVNVNEVFCDIMYFYEVTDFNDTIRCYDIRGDVKRGDEKLFSGLIADSLLGYMRRGDLVDGKSARTMKWVTNILEEMQGGVSFVAAGHMLRAARRLWKSRPTPLLEKFLRAMITIRLSGVLCDTTNVPSLQTLYAHLLDRGITKEQFFTAGPPGHSLIMSFRQIGNDRATFTYINSGAGMEKHPRRAFALEKITETTPVLSSATQLIRYVPFAIYKNQPESAIMKSCRERSIDELYFDKSPDNIDVDYRDWQYVDDQKSGTCYAIMYWYLPYWLEQRNPHAVETLKLDLQLELLRAALQYFEFTDSFLQQFLKKRFDKAKLDSVDAQALGALGPERNLKKVFIAFGWNEALQTIRRLHLKGFDMTRVMNDYKRLWDEYQGRNVWKRIRPDVEDTYVSAHNLILSNLEPLQGRKHVELSEGESDVLEALEGAQQGGNSFEFTKAAIAALLRKAGRRTIIQDKIVEGARALNVQDHHRALIFEAASRAKLTSYLRRLYGEGIFAVLRDDSGMESPIEFEDLPGVEDDWELRRGAVKFQGEA